jgi:predicted TIM-barrel fold metal-dependent hydrolase
MTPGIFLFVPATVLEVVYLHPLRDSIPPSSSLTLQDVSKQYITTMSITLEEHFLSQAAHSSEVATDDPIHGFPTSIINKLVDLDDERIKSMDENVAIQVLSHIPTNFLTAETIIACNDELVAAIRANKPRFAGFAALQMSDPVATTHELERCIKEHGFVGALIDNHSSGNYYDGLEYKIFWAKAVEIDVPIYIHPAWPRQKAKEALYSGGNWSPN